MKHGATVYLYELAWILPSIAIPVGMLVALIVTAFGAGIHLPSIAGRVDPTKVPRRRRSTSPAWCRRAPARYEVRMVGQIWSFTPNEIRVPAGSTVTFVATSRDVVHGLFIPGANVNVMLIPGQISRVTRALRPPGRVLHRLPRVLRHRAPHHGRQGHRRAAVLTAPAEGDRRA